MGNSLSTRSPPGSSTRPLRSRERRQPEPSFRATDDTLLEQSTIARAAANKGKNKAPSQNQRLTAQELRPPSSGELVPNRAELRLQSRFGEKRSLSSLPRQLEVQAQERASRFSLFRSPSTSFSLISNRQRKGSTATTASTTGSTCTNPLPLPLPLDTKTSLEYPTIDMSRLDALRAYAQVKHPAVQIPASTLLTHDHQVMAIFDAYPKAKYHFLILPRYPFHHQSDTTRVFDPICKLDALDDLKSLMLKPGVEARDEVFNAMKGMAREVEDMIKDEMMKTEGFTWGIDVGFHAIPSMKHIHLHVISSDRISDCLKTKKHYNSFRPDLGFFIPVMEVERWITNDRRYVKEKVEALSCAETLLDHPLECPVCDELFSNMPKLKKHLEWEFEEAKKAGRKRIRERGHQRDSDEDLF